MNNNNIFFKKLISAVYPNKCISCGEIIKEDDYLCSICDLAIERTELDNICTDCGLEKEFCVCKYQVFRFNALISVFKNTGLAQKTYYSYKFGKKQFSADFFANEMANAVKKCYSDVNFDFICSVPSYGKYKYDHSGYISKSISKMLMIPYEGDLLKCCKRVKKQHKSSFKDRLGNVEGKFLCNKSINNAVILLIDDIKTTGATIDECTRTLLFAGAKAVYCVTALGTISNSKIEK